MGEADVEPREPESESGAEPEEKRPAETDSAGVYFVSVEDFERRRPPRDTGREKPASDEKG